MKAAPDTRTRKIPRQARATETVETLLRATRDVLVSEGYDRASTNKVARAAGLSVGSLYQYFAGKEALVYALARREADREMVVLASTLNANADAPLPVVVRGLVDAVIALYRTDPKLRRILLTEIPMAGRLSDIRSFDRRGTEQLQTFLENRLSVTHPDLALDVFVAVHAIEGLIRKALLDRPALLSSPRYAEALTRLAADYLTPNPALKPRRKS